MKLALALTTLLLSASCVDDETAPPPPPQATDGDDNRNSNKPELSGVLAPDAGVDDFLDPKGRGVGTLVAPDAGVDDVGAKGGKTSHDED